MNDVWILCVNNEYTNLQIFVGVIEYTLVKDCWA
ncbi:MAG: hypothetical protein ACI9WL_001079 [Rubritalea sp.]|jgi:hypothetical protein